jgi:drug/metabolite transporter (DMT)-like permease
MGTLITLPAFLSAPKLPETPFQWLLCLVLVIFAVAAQVSMNQGFFYCRSWEGGLYMTMDAVFSVLAGVMFLNEPLTWRLFAGGGMIFCGVVVMNLLSARRIGFHSGETR